MKDSSQSPALLVRNFGPVREGFREYGGFIQFPTMTAFCGPQGSGKSTIAKLYSTCSWIEKNAFRRQGLATDTPINTALFRNSTSWQGLDDCFRPETEITFRGRYLSFRYASGKVSAVSTIEDDSYDIPKILYMPAERNIASVVRDAPGIKTLPQPLQELLVEFETAKQRLPTFRLPVNGFSYRFDKKKNESWIVNGRGADSSQTHLELASSGLQSMVPLLLVAESIAGNIRSGSRNPTEFGLSPSEVLARRERLERLLEESDSGSAGSESVILRHLARATRFVHIVEEPEQNLFPPAQDAVLNKLLMITRETPGNQLIVSTHSPYLVNHLVLSAKAAELFGRIRDKGSAAFRKLKRIIPPESAVPIKEMALYETSEDGTISRVPVFHGTFDDSNALNTALGAWNRQFEKMLEIEDDLSDGN